MSKDKQINIRLDGDIVEMLDAVAEEVSSKVRKSLPGFKASRLDVVRAFIVEGLTHRGYSIEPGAVLAPPEPVVLKHGQSASSALLKELEKGTTLSQAELAKKYNIGQPAVSRIHKRLRKEKGK